jgi:hypothetical protein
MSYESKDFSKMKANAYSLDFERNIVVQNDWVAKIFHQFIGDAEIEALKGVTMNILVRVLLVTYDPNSPLVVRIQDVKQRKIEAFKLFNTKTYKDGRFSSDVDDVILGKNPKFNRMVLQFLKAIDSMAYCSMTFYLESYYDLLGQLQSQQGKDLAQILILIEKIETQVKRKSREVFANDENLVNYVASESIYEQAEALTPEFFAKKFKLMKETAND